MSTVLKVESKNQANRRTPEQGMYYVPSMHMPPQVTRVASHPFSSSSLSPKKYCSTQHGSMSQGDTRTKAEPAPSSLFSSCHNLLLCHGRSPARDSPTQTTSTYTQEETQCHNSFYYSTKEKKARGLGFPRHNARVTLTFELGEPGRQDKSAESLLPPPKEKQLTGRVCHDSAEKLDAKNRCRISSWMNSVTARDNRACEPTPNTNLPDFSSSR